MYGTTDVLKLECIGGMLLVHGCTFCVLFVFFWFFRCKLNFLKVFFIMFRFWLQGSLQNPLLVFKFCIKEEEDMWGVCIGSQLNWMVHINSVIKMSLYFVMHCRWKLLIIFMYNTVVNQVGSNVSTKPLWCDFDTVTCQFDSLMFLCRVRVDCYMPLKFIVSQIFLLFINLSH